MLAFLVEAGYWIVPKPADLGLVLFDALKAEDYFGRVLDVKKLDEMGRFQPELSIPASLLATAGLLVLASIQLEDNDY